MDEACSKVSLRGFKVPENVYKLEKTQTELAKELEDAIKSGNMTEASMLHKELNEAEEKLEQIKKRFHKRNDVKHLEVTEEDIAEVVSQWTKIPVSRLAESESARASDSGIGKQIFIITKTYPVVTSVSFKIGKTIDDTFDQRQRIEAEK